MNDFEYDVMLKKRLANQAKYRKCGSKSKKCPMSTDHMTRRQWEKRCGEVMTYQLRKPMAWKDFKAQPIHIQKMYIEDLMGVYDVTATDLARMFDVTPATVLRHCGKDGLDVRFTKGKHMNAQQRDMFEKFLRDELNDDGGDIENVHAEEDVVVEHEDVEDETRQRIDINAGKQSADMNMTAFDLSFSGKFNRDMLYNSLSSMLPAGTEVKIDIRCTICS
ncbi:hypothetical protein [Intestinimonas butyriciproducens]|uniref:hypothetical protein n=1 Tax=Intestinimonas butyriciproducens TaxID=1297617 RepID=UPI00189815A4|nr:hypothetical protein [Intestinimonas butyriciproducens]MDB7829192.1 hypothetical protein [Intestinimonas butyriciproducens]